MPSAENDTTLDLLARNQANTFALLDAAINAPAKTPHEVMLEQAEVDRELLGIKPGIFLEDDDPRARRTDEDTSHETADATAEKASAARARVLEVHREHPDGLTDWALTKICVQRDADEWGLNLDWDTWRRRRSDLTGRGLIVATNERDKGRTGRPAKVWKVVSR